MSRQRWGAFSVKDHTRPQSFTAEVLLYDRLVIPCPPADDDAAEAEWIAQGWNPARLREVLAILGDDLAIKVAWDHQNREIFREHHRSVPSDNWFFKTAVLIANQTIPVPGLPEDVSAVRLVAAYPSLGEFNRRYPLSVQTTGDVRDKSRSELGVLLAHKFLTPGGDFSKEDGLARLKVAAVLAREKEFRESRRMMYEWQENVLDRGLSIGAAATEMREYLETYNGMIRAAMKSVRWQQAIAVVASVGAGIAVGGAAVATTAAPVIGLPIIANVLGSAIGEMLAVARLVTLEKKPRVQAGESAPAAMFHTARRRIGLTG
jgi:hypothetical protein